MGCVSVPMVTPAISFTRSSMLACEYSMWWASSRRKHRMHSTWVSGIYMMPHRRHYVLCLPAICWTGSSLLCVSGICHLLGYSRQEITCGQKRFYLNLCCLGKKISENIGGNYDISKSSVCLQKC